MSQDPKQIVQAYANAINRHDIPAMAKLMSDDHTFIDSGGTTVTGLDVMLPGWEDYFRMFPDYKIEIENIIAENEMVAAFGSATGTYNGKRGMVPENRITMPAAWQAIVENDKIKLWRVYADWSEGGEIIKTDNEIT